MIKLINPVNNLPIIEKINGLYSYEEELIYKYYQGAFRIVPDDNYSTNFGLQWNTFQKTQIDKYSGSNITHQRFFSETRWNNDLEDEVILEVGSGAGRFSQIILDYTKAALYSVDFSNAVEANYKNNGPNERLKLFQASIYEMPFEKNSFDKVICLGVLQHTPDFKKSIECLIEMVKPGGEIVIDFYPIKGWYTKICAKYILRPFTKKMNHDKLMFLIRKNINWLIKFYKFNSWIKFGFLNRFLPICDIKRTLPEKLNDIDLNEFVILDTFDMFSPQYDNPQKLKTVEKWFKEEGLIEVDANFIKYGSNFEAATVKGTKPL